MADFFLKKGDTLPKLAATLKDSEGYPIVLSGATVRFKMRKEGTRTSKVDAVATVVDAEEGQVEYAWQAADTDTAGQYEAEWVITNGGNVQRVPNDRFFAVSIQEGI